MIDGCRLVAANLFDVFVGHLGYRPFLASLNEWPTPVFEVDQMAAPTMEKRRSHTGVVGAHLVTDDLSGSDSPADE